MNTLEKQDIQQLKQVIASVKASNGNNIMLIANTEEQVKMFEELLPGIEILCMNGRLESDDKVYILPCKYKPIKFTWED